MNFRTVEQVDIRDAAELFDCYRQFYRQPPNPCAARSFLADRIRKRDSMILLTEHHGVLAGFVQVYHTFSSIAAADVWIINDLFVQPFRRGQGDARALIQEVHRLARIVDIRQIRLSTEVTNTAAQKLYESLGYVVDERFKHYLVAP